MKSLLRAVDSRWLWGMTAILLFNLLLAVILHLAGLGTTLNLSLVIVALVLSFLGLSFSFHRRYISPYDLATMYVEGLVRQKFDPPLPETGEPEARRLMAALNQLAGDLQAQRDKLNKLESLRIDFVANVSHELRTPLTSIRGYTETLKAGAYKEADTCLKFLNRIEENAHRLSLLISDLLDLSRLESGPQDMEWAVFPSHSFSEKLDSMFFPALKKKGQTLHMNFSDTQLEGDRKKLEQVFVNLIDNACRYTQNGATIEVQEKREKNDTVFEISDNGPGISPEHLPRIFERFYRVDKARSKETGGTGLGLSIVKHIVLAHGGAIQAANCSPGTRFTFTIPRRYL